MAESKNKIEELEKAIETKEVEKELESVEKENRPIAVDSEKKKVFGVAGWNPKTKLGREVKDGKIRNIDEILNNDRKILEAEIVDSLIEVKSDLIAVGQSKGKFGGGKRRAWRQTQRKTQEGNIPTFSAVAVIGDENGHVGIASGRAKETLPAREKALRKAKINIIKVKRTCGAFDCSCSENHTIPFEVRGKAGSVRVILIPAPQGTGLVVGNELKKVLKLVGIKDIYSKTFGQKRTSFNLVKACMVALKKTNKSDKKRGVE